MRVKRFTAPDYFNLKADKDDVHQGLATPDTRAKSGTPEGFAWHAKQNHAQANFKI